MEKHVINPVLANVAYFLYPSLLYPTKEYEKGNLTQESYIFAPNHTNNLDGYLIWSLLAKDYDIDTFMYREFWDNFPLYAKVLPLFNVYPISRDELHPEEILSELRKLKDKNHSLIIFPQGRHVDPQLMVELAKYHLRTIPLGTFFISSRSKKELVPIYMEPQILGQENAVIYGNPLKPSDFETTPGRMKKDDMIEFARAWLEEINKLYQSAEDITGRRQHDYEIKRFYTDASGLRYRALDDPNSLMSSISEVKELIAKYEETGITDLEVLGQMANVDSKTIEKIGDIKETYEKCLVKHK